MARSFGTVKASSSLAAPLLASPRPLSLCCPRVAALTAPVLTAAPAAAKDYDFPGAALGYTGTPNKNKVGL